MRIFIDYPNYPGPLRVTPHSTVETHLFIQNWPSEA
uniref:Uncharacterized protein n=1 Tax=Rhizophora mucronata TaxID=61149 RepID=A0A2P2PXI5_RHIMU